MAVDSKQGVNGSSNGKLLSKAGRKRPSSLMAQASSLPKVEHSLDEFIAKANQTLVDVSNWGAADAEAKAEDDKRREQDALRMRAAETQMKEGEAREQSLRRQLDGLQGKLAEAEARAAVAASSAADGRGPTLGSAAHDQTLAQLRAQIEAAEQQRKSAELKNTQLSSALSEAKNEVAIARASAPSISVPTPSFDDGEAAERVRIAEAKATKAIAAAKAAQAGLTVSSADIAAIESGLVVTNMDAPKSSPWIAIAIAFVGGLGIMFAVWKFVLNKDDAKPAAAVPAAVAPAAAAQPDQVPTPAAATAPAATAPVAPSKPIVTPIVTPIEEEPAKTEAVKAEPTKAEPVATEPVKAEPVKATKAPTKAPAKAVTKAPTKAPAKATKAPASKGTIADPFAETPAPKKTAPVKKATKPTTGGVVDPF